MLGGLFKKEKGQMSIEVLIIMAVLTIGALVAGTYYISTINANIKKAKSVDFDGSRAFGIKTPQTVVCNDGVCEGSENCSNCALDCGTCPPVSCNPAQLDGITFTPPGGTYSNTTNVSLIFNGSCTQPVNIYYTTDGLDPTTSDAPYSSSTPIVVSENTTIIAKAFLRSNQTISGNSNSQYYIINKTGCNSPLGTAQFSPPGGTYTTPQTVSLSYTDPNCLDYNIYYTLNGTEPTSSSIRYTTPITIASTTTIKAKVFAKNYLGQDVNGDTNSQEYIITTNMCFVGHPEGSGTSADPKIICTPDDLNAVRDQIYLYYVLGQDIDLNVSPYNTGNGWEPIIIFKGSLDGNGHVIKNMYLNYDKTDGATVGLFNQSEGQILNVGLVDFNILNKMQGANIASLVGSNIGLIENSFSKGKITVGNSVYGGWAAGFVHSNYGVIKNSYADINIFGKINGASGFVLQNIPVGIIKNSYAKGIINIDCAGLTACAVGGFVNQNSGNIDASYSLINILRGKSVGGFVEHNDGNITNSYYKGDLNATNRVGGFAGLNSGNISRSFSIGDLVIENGMIGGFVGFGSGGKIEDCYSLGNIILNNLVSTTGGFIGYQNYNPPINNCYSIGKIILEGEVSPTDKGFSGTPISGTYNYWDINASGQLTSPSGAIGKTTNQMVTTTTFNDWNSQIWDLETGCYPTLKNNPQSPKLCPGTTTTTTCESGGSGTPGDPFVICNPQDLYNIRNKLYEYQKLYFQDYTTPKLHFVLGQDIDLNHTKLLADYSWYKTYGFPSIGALFIRDEYALDLEFYFRGVFDGNNHKLKNVYINRTTIDPTDVTKLYYNGLDYNSSIHQTEGLFGKIVDVDSEIKNLIIENITVNNSIDYTSIGGLSNKLYYGKINNIKINGKVINSISPGGTTDFPTGGLVGENTGGEINNSSFDGNVSGDDIVGGLVGYNNSLSQYNLGKITKSFAKGKVNGKDNVGGLVGYNNGDITENYFFGDVNGNANIGGLIGFNKEEATANTKIENNYSFANVTGITKVGGFIGFNYYPGSNLSDVKNNYTVSTVSTGYTSYPFFGASHTNSANTQNSYFDCSHAGTDCSTLNYLAIPKTTSQMRIQSTFTNWDFSSIWGINSTINNGYPYLLENTPQ